MTENKTDFELQDVMGGFENLNPSVLKRRLEFYKLKDSLVSGEMQREITSWVDDLRDRVGNREGWLAAEKEANDNEISGFLKKEKVGEIELVMAVLSDLAHPGHDKGHFLRDRITSLLLVTGDEFVTKASLSERVTGFWGGYFHDIGTVFVDRYLDKNLSASHAEVGAWVTDQLLKDIVPKNLLDMICYSIAAHTHYTKERQVDMLDGCSKKPYWDELWQDEEGAWHGVAVRVTRLSDRGDMLGPVHLVREIMARMHAVQAGGYNFDGYKWFEINKESLNSLLKPEVRTNWEGSPTALEWMKVFMNSATEVTEYSKDDNKFPFFEWLKEKHLIWGEELIEIMLPVGDFGPVSFEDLGSIEALFLQVSRCRFEFDEFWNNFKKVWEEQPIYVKKKWVKGFKYIRKSYYEYLDEIKQITESMLNIRSDDKLLEVLKPTVMEYFNQLW
jgi:hypothetical protein